MNPSGLPASRVRFPSILIPLCAAVALGALLTAFPAQAAERKTEVSADQQEFEKARDEHRAAMDKFFEKYQKATEAGRENLRSPDPKPYAERMWKIVNHDPAAPVAAAALVWLVSEDRDNSGKISGKILDTIRDHHLKSDRIGTLCFYLGRMTGGPALLRQIARENPHPGVQASALYSLGQHLQREDSSEAEGVFSDLEAKFPNEKIGDQKAGQLAKNSLFAIRNLGIGKTAPEIEGEDIDGKKFKLSDYRGKVVVIDFWGDW